MNKIGEITEDSLTLEQAARYLAVSATSLVQKPWRMRWDIPSVTVKGRLRFDRDALDRVRRQRGRGGA